MRGSRGGARKRSEPTCRDRDVHRRRMTRVQGSTYRGHAWKRADTSCVIPGATSAVRGIAGRCGVVDASARRRALHGGSACRSNLDHMAVSTAVSRPVCGRPRTRARDDTVPAGRLRRQPPERKRPHRVLLTDWFACAEAEALWARPAIARQPRLSSAYAMNASGRTRRPSCPPAVRRSDQSLRLTLLNPISHLTGFQSIFS